MKSNITDEIKDLFSQTVTWAKLEIEYVKLTAAEKLTILLSMIILGAICMLFLLPLVIMLLLALAGVFKLMMPSALAYLSVAGIVAVMIALVFAFRKTLVINPLSKFITKLVLENRSNNTNS